MKSRGFRLRNLRDSSEHLARPGEVESAFRDDILQRSQHKVCPVDVGVQSGEFIVERVADKTLSGQMVALVRLNGPKNLINARKAFQRGSMQMEPANHGLEASQPSGRIFQGDSPHNPMD